MPWHVTLILLLSEAYSTVIFVYVLMSWIPQKRGIIADIDMALGRICDPYLNVFRKLLPSIGGMIDVSPILALIVLQLVTKFLVNLLV